MRRSNAILSHFSNEFSSPFLCYLFVVVQQGLCSLCYHKKVALFPHFSFFFSLPEFRSSLDKLASSPSRELWASSISEDFQHSGFGCL